LAGKACFAALAALLLMWGCPQQRQQHRQCNRLPAAVLPQGLLLYQQWVLEGSPLLSASSGNLRADTF